MRFSILSDLNIATQLAWVGAFLPALILATSRKHRRLKWMRCYLALCMGFTSL